MYKSGVAQDSIWKIIGMILLVLVMALVIYGTTTEGLNPLIDKVKVKFDEVSAFLDSFGEDYSEFGSHEGCHVANVAEISGGKKFLNSLGVRNLDSVIEVCPNGVCRINGSDFGVYRFGDGRLDEFGEGVWKKSLFGVGGKNIEEDVYFNRYNVAIDFLEDKGLKDIYDSSFSKRFVLYGDGSGFNDEVYAVWQNGEWVIQERGKKVVYFESDDAAIDYFSDIVYGGDDDRVFWAIKNVFRMDDSKKISGVSGDVRRDDVCDAFCGREGGYSLPKDKTAYCKGFLKNDNLCCCYGSERDFVFVDSGYRVPHVIGKLIGNVNGGSFDELDDDEEIFNLKGEFFEIKQGLISDARISDEDLVEFRSAVSGESVQIEDKNFDVSLDEDGEFPVVVFSSDGDSEVFGLKFTSFARIESDLIEGVKLRYFPVYFVVRSEGKWKRVGNEDIYRLKREDIEKMRRDNLIGEFLGAKCK